MCRRMGSHFHDWATHFPDFWDKKILVSGDFKHTVGRFAVKIGVVLIFGSH